MRYKEQIRLIKQSKPKNQFLFFIYGLKELVINPWKNIFIVAYVALTILVWNKKNLIFNIFENLPFFNLYKLIMNTSLLVLAFLFLLILIITIGKPFCSNKIHDNLLRISFINSANEVPTLLAKYKDKKNPLVTIMEFENSGIPLSEFENKKDILESALNIQIIKINYGKNTRRIIIHTISSNKQMPKILPWKKEYTSDKEFELFLGENLYEKVSINLTTNSHILIGGASNSGKSLLLKLLLFQCISKGANVIIADFKGGVDYSTSWHKHCQIILDERALLETLTNLVDELERRKLILKSSGRSKIEDYNISNSKLQRIIFACDEIAEILDKTGCSKEQKDTIFEIEQLLNVISRTGRAFGIHLFLSTQRPDSNILPGQIKANINYRVCGRADSVLSSIIIDSNEASKRIPSDSQGLFLNQDNIIFKAYYLDVEQF